MSGLSSCIGATTIPILQDGPDSPLWTAFGIRGGYAVVAGDGTLVGLLQGGSIPRDADDLTALVESALP